MTPMSVDEFDFRNNLAVALTKVLAPHIAHNETIVSQSFYIADSVTARISADAAVLDKAAQEKREAGRAIRQAEFDALVGGLATCGSTSANTAACGDGQVNKTDQRCSQTEAAHPHPHPLRRRDDKVEVRELSVEQAIDMITALFNDKP